MSRGYLSRMFAATMAASVSLASGSSTATTPSSNDIVVKAEVDSTKYPESSTPLLVFLGGQAAQDAAQCMRDAGALPPLGRTRQILNSVVGPDPISFTQQGFQNPPDYAKEIKGYKTIYVYDSSRPNTYEGWDTLNGPKVKQTLDTSSSDHPRPMGDAAAACIDRVVQQAGIRIPLPQARP